MQFVILGTLAQVVLQFGNALPEKKNLQSKYYNFKLKHGGKNHKPHSDQKVITKSIQLLLVIEEFAHVIRNVHR